MKEDTVNLDSLKQDDNLQVIEQIENGKLQTLLDGVNCAFKQIRDHWVTMDESPSHGIIPIY